MPQRIDHAQLHRDIGAVQARLGALEKAREEDRKLLHQINTRLAELRGGRKALAWLVGAAATAGAGVTWIFKHVTFN